MGLMHGNKNYLPYQTPVHSGGDWKGILLSMWASLIHNTIHTPSCWLSSCVRWIKAAVSQVSRPNQVRAVSVQLQVGKDLPANTFHPAEREGAKRQQSRRARVVQTGTNSYILGLYSATKTCCMLVDLWYLPFLLRLSGTSVFLL